MYEYITEGIVLAKRPFKELDARVSVFTKHFGRLDAKVTSARKITSKLSPHLEPGNIVSIRFIDKNSLHIVDALKKGKIDILFSDLMTLGDLLPQEDPEPALWHMLREGTFSWRRALSILGWDPEYAECEYCKRESPRYFDPISQHFYCGVCGVHSQNSEHGLLYV